ncbi:MAG: flagellar basal body L-ring protein FlgH [Alphaproteobacteria bacterium]|nr:flagellar basal body L-ring protein FlgH [Alphaproteobacteria bacterium]
MSDPSRLAGVAAIGIAMLGGCSSMSDSLASPQLSPISNPASVAGAEKVSMPLPAPKTEPAGANSLWRSGARSFFGDQRASKIGDILTVNIQIADSAQVNNTTQRDRSSSEKAGIGALFGFESKLQKTLPGTPALDPALSLNSTTASKGAGSVNRAETVKLTVAAVITDKLPNGNLVIGGSQEVLVNNELRELLVSGVIRPQDIAADNTIEHTKIAEARISYGGKGDITQLQRARYGQRAIEKVMPF